MKETKAGRQNRQGGKGRPTTTPTKAVQEAKACRQAGSRRGNVDWQKEVGTNKEEHREGTKARRARADK
jgi:hypothetical protein